MIMDTNHKDFSRVILKDAMGQRIALAKSYNTETGELEVFVSTDRNDRIAVEQPEDNPNIKSVVVAKTVVKGFKLYYKDTGELYEKN